MAPRRQAEERKLRPREHVIADLSVNYVERQILLCGYSINRVQKDYGLNLLMSTYNDKGEVENGHVHFQLKATDSLRLLKDGQTISSVVEIADVRWWRKEAMPVILAIYDAQGDQAYWVYVQAHLEAKGIKLEALPKKQTRLTLPIPISNRLNTRAVQKFREYRANVVEQLRGVKHGHK